MFLILKNTSLFDHHNIFKIQKSNIEKISKTDLEKVNLVNNLNLEDELYVIQSFSKLGDFLYPKRYKKG